MALVIDNITVIKKPVEGATNKNKWHDLLGVEAHLKLIPALKKHLFVVP